MGNFAEADVGAAAKAAQGDIDTYAANALSAVEPVAMPSATPSPRPEALPNEQRARAADRPQPPAQPTASAAIDADAAPAVYRCAGETRISERSNRDLSGSAGKSTDAGIWRRGDGIALSERGRAGTPSVDRAADPCSAD